MSYVAITYYQAFESDVSGWQENSTHRHYGEVWFGVRVVETIKAITTDAMSAYLLSLLARCVYPLNFTPVQALSDVWGPYFFIIDMKH